MAIELHTFQRIVVEGVLARLREQRRTLDSLASADEAARDEARRKGAGIVLQAPTGSGKTAMAIDTVAAFSREAKVLWFWFAPYAGLVDQASAVLRAQAPQLRILSLEVDRRPDALAPGAIFVTTWAALATARASSRLARQRSDAGMAIDALIEVARAEGYRIACVIDEAHHGFHKARQAREFFTGVLRPDHALMMTATPRDADVAAFEKDTGWRLGDPADWASVARQDAVEAGLLKRGVRTVRFLARDDDTRSLIDFERLALRECSVMHRRIAQRLNEAGVALTPLMLVQVPDGKQAMADARTYLVEELGFADEAVRIHTSDEPDPDLIALANDPGVEVLIFKMAVALGFDAPRAFTLSALRGARDPVFAVQIIGRILRVHRLLQGRANLPPELEFGWVFLANAEAQEGLASAGAQLNALRTQAPAIGAGMILSYVGDSPTLQVVDEGRSFGLDADESWASPRDHDAMPMAPGTTAVQSGLPLGAGAGGELSAREARAQVALGFALGTVQRGHRYARRDEVPSELVGERLPSAPADAEMRLVDFVDFSDEVLASRIKTRAAVRRAEADVFAADRAHEGDRDVWANLAPEAVAARAEQVMLRLGELNQRELRLRLLDRFRTAIERGGAAPPSDEEELEQQLDLVLVRHQRLLRDAFRVFRLRELRESPVRLLEEFESDSPLLPARRNAYGVFPGGLNPDEEAVARLLDDSPLVRWWHRNRSDPRLPDALGLYAWDEGEGFFPDFVVSIEGRDTAHSIVLLEVKGEFLWRDRREVAKAHAESAVYGRVEFAGRAKHAREFEFLRVLDGRLDRAGRFDIARLRWR